MFKIKFGWWPGHWGLKGKTREIAKAEYELSGSDLEIRLLEINADMFEKTEYERKHLEIKKKYGLVTDTEYRQCLANLITDTTNRKIALLEIDKDTGAISKTEYEKQLATLKGKRWVSVINMDFSKGGPLEGSFELDWNDIFIEELKNEGYMGLTDEAIVNQWFMELCKNVALEEFDGVGTFSSDAEANLEAVKRWSGDSTNTPNGRKIYQ